ncbi:MULTISPECIES: hypothetical protein [unclassified Methylobacterium]|uniref:hypothetical protein n=1 Tax=unclassified Methylobacterium TaxID=2615210 RepID=UPI000EC87B2D|nr:MULTISPECIES: hypothetical protein [unclassified Methylobacterium]GBU19671.1 hypothetical protein AwMethylo_38860 [Methylobacterium sp.]
MTASDRSTLLAIAALLRASSPTKGPAPRYADEELQAAVAGAGARLFATTLKNPVRRS